MTGIVAQNVGRTSGLIKSAGGGGGVWTLIKTLTSDGSDATFDFVNGASDVVLDSTYPIYVFKFINIHAETDNTHITFNFSVDTGSNYNVTKTTSFFRAYQNESASDTAFEYRTDMDIAQGTGFQKLNSPLENDNDQSGCGTLTIFSPSSTVFVKHFISALQSGCNGEYSIQDYVGGYGNTTSAVDAIQFKMSDGDIQAGKIKMYGLKDSA